MLRRIIYISKSLIGDDHEGIEAIMSSSIRRNGESGVTGMLWADGRNFAQVIEGEPDKAGMTMDRILADRRHTDVEVLLDRTVITRQFGSWSMRRGSDDDEAAPGTAFMIGFAIGERRASARRLYDIVGASVRLS
jgi:hypothetical protein